MAAADERGRANRALSEVGGRTRSHKQAKVWRDEVEVIEVNVQEDGRLYVLVEIYGKRFFGLLDSGATASFLGEKAWDQLTGNKVSIIGQESWARLRKSNVKLLKTKTKSVRVANGGQCDVLGRGPDFLVPPAIAQ